VTLCPCGKKNYNMSKWILKAVVQKTISFLPQKEKINFLFQKYVTNGVALTDQYFTYKITHSRDHINYFKKYGQPNFSGQNMLELGTGWYPIVPIAMYLSGMDQVISIDIQSWMTKESELITIEKFVEWRLQGKLDAYLPDIQEDRWQILTDIIRDSNKLSQEEINQKIGFQSMIVDARNTGFEAQNFDYICSNNTFEHVHTVVLKDILKEFARIIKKEGVMSHFIDMSDHFAHFDQSINIYNFLQYSNSKWNLIDNNIQPQNRLRFIDYKKMYQHLNIPITEEEPVEGNVDLVAKMSLSEEFKTYPLEELAISHAYLVSKI